MVVFARGAPSPIKSTSSRRSMDQEPLGTEHAMQHFLKDARRRREHASSHVREQKATGMPEAPRTKQRQQRVEDRHVAHTNRPISRYVAVARLLVRLVP